jgi:pilus assembly protein CpaB
MKSKALIPLAVGVVVGIVAIKYTMNALSNAQGAPGSETVKVIMAQKDIPATVTITADMVVVAQTPRTPLLPREIFTDIKELDGRVALKSIPRGSPVLPSMVAPVGTKPGLTTRVPEGFRAVAVKIDESSGVGYLVQPTDWVDVLSVMETKKFGKAQTESKLILERVQVAAVGQLLNDGPEKGTSRNVQTVTLLVKTADVPKLHLAQTRGRVTLAMRGADDATMILREDDNQDELEFLAMNAPQQAPPAPEQARITPFTVTVVNDSASGDKRTSAQHVTFPDANSMSIIDVEQGGASSHRTSETRNPAPDPIPAPSRTGDEVNVNP